MTQIQILAQNFLDLADSLNIEVSRYLNGSKRLEDLEAYLKVLESEKAFLVALYNETGEKYKCCLNYELAESVL